MVFSIVHSWQKLTQYWIIIRHLSIGDLLRYTVKVVLWLPCVLWRILESFLWFCWQLLKGLNRKLLATVLDGLLILLVALGLGFAGVKLGLVAQQFVTIADKPQVTTMPVDSKPEVIKPVDEATKPIEPTKTTSPVKVEMVDEELYPTHQWLGFFVAGLAVMLLLMVWRLSLRVQDTQVFIEVMTEWRDWLSRHHDTPRDWKRLMNRARLFAMRVRVHQQKPWYENIDKKWQAFRFQCPPLSVVETPVVLDERLAMNLMMLDVYSKGKLVRILPPLLNKSDGEWHRELVSLDDGDGSWVYFDMLCDFIDQLAPAKKETPEGKQARKQLGLWLSLYAGLNSTRQNAQPPSNNTSEQT